jgi:hypothetical protein
MLRAVAEMKIDIDDSTRSALGLILCTAMVMLLK